MGKIVSILVVLAVLIGFLFVVGKNRMPTTDDLPSTTEVPADVLAHIQSKANLIVVDSPVPLGNITSPIVVRGKARGTWYFEASFPIDIVNWDGLIIGQGHAEAQGDWMTEEFVPFIGTIEFTEPAIQGELGKRGTIIFRKDNPSGLAEHDDALEIPITFGD